MYVNPFIKQEDEQLHRWERRQTRFLVPQVTLYLWAVGTTLLVPYTVGNPASFGTYKSSISKRQTSPQFKRKTYSKRKIECAKREAEREREISRLQHGAP